MSNRVVLRFLGEDGDLSRTLKKVEGDADRLGRGLGRLGKTLGGIGAVGNAVHVVAALGTSLSQMSGAALLAPAGIIGLAGAVATAKIGMQGFGDAVKKGGADLAKLEPNARSAAVAIRAMKPEWEGVRKTVQGNMFAGVAGDIKQLGGSYLPVLKTGLGGIATSFNGMARSGAAALKTPEAVGSVRAVLDATGASLGRMSGAVGNVVSGFLTLAGAGAKFIGATGGGLTNLTAKFKVWADSITAGGQFDRWVASAGVAFGQLFGLIRNLGSIFTSVISGLAGPTGGLFGTLQAVTTQLATFLKSAEGQQALHSLGDVLRTVAQVLNDVLGAALRQLGPIIVAIAPAFSQLATALGPILLGAIQALGPPLTNFATFLSSSPGLVLGLTGVIAGLWAAFQIGQAAINAVRIATLAWNGIQLIVRGATMAWTAVQWALNVAMSANPIGIVIAIVIALVAAIIYAWNNCETFRTVVIAVWNGIKTAFSAAINWIKGALAWFGTLGSLFAGWIGRARDAIVAGFNNAVAWVRGLPGMILGALGNLGSLLWNAGKSILQGFLDGLKSMWGAITGFVGGIADWISAHKGPISLDLRLLTPAGDAIMRGLLGGLKTGYVPVQAFVSGVVGDLAATAAEPATAAAQAIKGGPQSAAAPPAATGRTVTFTGNTTDALATVFMQMVRSGKIVIA
jgi:hypothetical protein